MEKVVNSQKQMCWRQRDGTLRKNQKEMLGIKNTVTEIKNQQNGHSQGKNQ